MPRRPVHAFFGGAAGVVTANRLAKDEPLLFAVLETGAGLLGGIHGGCAPDKLEPADTPNHRGPFHSIVAAVAGGTAVAKWAPEVVAEYRARLVELRADAEGEADPLKRLLKWALVALAHALLGYATGFAAGYASHLVLDGVLTPSSLPLLTNGT